MFFIHKGDGCVRPPMRRKVYTIEDPKHAAAFRKAARKLGADPGEEQFQAVLRIVGKHKPKPRSKKKKSD